MLSPHILVYVLETSKEISHGLERLRYEGIFLLHARCQIDRCFLFTAARKRNSFMARILDNAVIKRQFAVF